MGKSKKLDHKKVRNLLKYCRLEARDLENIFVFVIQLSERAKEWLHRLHEEVSRGAKTSDNKEASKYTKLTHLIHDYDIVIGRLETLSKEIQTQQRRLDNEFKKSGFVPNSEIQREIKLAA